MLAAVGMGHQDKVDVYGWMAVCNSWLEMAEEIDWLRAAVPLLEDPQPTYVKLQVWMRQTEDGYEPIYKLSDGAEYRGDLYGRP
jgi:hypothetical protein